MDKIVEQENEVILAELAPQSSTHDGTSSAPPSDGTTPAPVGTMTPPAEDAQSPTEGTPVGTMTPPAKAAQSPTDGTPNDNAPAIHNTSAP
eukprot:7287675-Karenia_brevis.AAC.1